MIAGLMRSVGFYIFSAGVMALLAGKSTVTSDEVVADDTQSLAELAKEPR
jgi:hypothetical protein